MEFLESDTVELKREVVSDLWKEVVAFANSKGGKIYIGLDNEGKDVGVNEPDKTMLQINNMIRDSIKPDVTMFVVYKLIDIDGKNVIEISVERGTDRPYYLVSKGLVPSGVYLRNGSASDPASETAIRKMIKETDGDVFENIRSLEQNLTFKVTKEEFSRRGLSFGKQEMRTLGIISEDGIYSNLGMLLFDQCSITMKAATFGGENKNDFQDRQEFGGSLFLQMEEIYRYLTARNQLRATIKGFYREDTLSYPEVALREALLNCLIHRDYAFSASSMVNIYSDRIEFVSVGGLANEAKLEDILFGGLSTCRNPKLAAVFYSLKLIEAYGTGIRKIIDSYEGSGLEVKFEVYPNVFKLTLPNRNYLAKANQKEKEPETSYDREGKILSLFDDGRETIARSDVDEALGAAVSTSARLLKKMIEKGLLSQEGNGKKTVYKKQ